MTVTYTENFRFGIPDFTSGPWHAEFAELVNHIDRVAFGTMLGSSATVWENDHAYVGGNVVIDPDIGSIWMALLSHTSAVAPTTFAQDRAANPTYWMPVTAGLSDTPQFTRVGIGVPAHPFLPLIVAQDGITPSSALIAGTVTEVGFSSPGLFMRLLGVPGSASISFMSANGTAAVPTASVNADVLGSIFFNGFDGTGRIGLAQIRAFVDGAVSAGNVPARLSFFTGPAGVTAERYRITSDGDHRWYNAAGSAFLMSFDSATGDLIFDNGTQDSPGVQFNSFGANPWQIDNFFGTLRHHSSGLVLFEQAATHTNIHTTAFPSFQVIRNSAGTNAAQTVQQFVARTTGDMVDDYGVLLNFLISDSGIGDTVIAGIKAIRRGADNSGTLVFSAREAGVSVDTMQVLPDRVRIQGADGIGVQLNLTSYNSVSAATRAQTSFFRARGTAAAPTALLLGDLLGTFSYSGAFDTSGSFATAALMYATAAENWGANRGTQFSMELIGVGEAVRTMVFQLQKVAGAGLTALMIWDNDNGVLERVTVGAADSGGAGFKVLRIPN